MLTAAELYRVLESGYGEPDWWSEDPFTVMFQSVLVQNTSWASVRRVYEGMDISSRIILCMTEEELMAKIRPCGLASSKAKTVRRLAEWYRSHEAVAPSMTTDDLRSALMAIRGVGRETADVILLYAFRRSVFVVDAYARRLFERLGYGFRDDDSIRDFFETGLDLDVTRLGGIHRLILEHGIERCRREPECDGCPLSDGCAHRSR